MGTVSDFEREVWARQGRRVPSECVYKNGVDVTDEDPSTWPWPWSLYYQQGWRPQPKPIRTDGN